MAKATVVKGYTLENDFFNLSGGAQWTFAQKDGKDWFIKRFKDPVCPKDESAYDKELIREKLAQGIRFYKQKRAIYDAVNACDNGNIVTIEDFFLWESRYHVVTERIHAENIDVKDIAAMPEKEKYLLLKTLASNMMRLHEKQLIYADIRPDNILFKRSAAGKLVAKLIDFDGCYFEYDPPGPKGIPLSEPYIAPETGEVVFDGKEIHLTTKVDVFSLGLLFHLYWVGEMPEFDEEEYGFAFGALLDGGTLTVSGDIPYRLAALIRRMLLRDPEGRPTMAEVLQELKAITGDVPAAHSTEKPAVKTGGFSSTITFSGFKAAKKPAADVIILPDKLPYLAEPSADTAPAPKSDKPGLFYVPTDF